MATPTLIDTNSESVKELFKDSLFLKHVEIVLWQLESQLAIIHETGQKLTTVNEANKQFVTDSHGKAIKLGSPRSNGLNLDDFKRNLISNFVYKLVPAINEQLNVNFEISNRDHDNLVENYMVGDIDLAPIYDALEAYIAGRSLKEIRHDEALGKFNELTRASWSYLDDAYKGKKTLAEPGNTVNNFVAITKTSFTLSGFSIASFWGDEVSPATHNNLETLNQYNKIVVGDNVTFGNARIPMEKVTDSYKPVASLKSSVKSINVYKNNNVKVTFHTEEGLLKFLNPLVEYNKLDAVL